MVWKRFQLTFRSIELLRLSMVLHAAELRGGTGGGEEADGVRSLTTAAYIGSPAVPELAK